MIVADFNEAREYIRSHPGDYLRKARDGKSWVCPICGDGDDEWGKGVTTKDGIHLTCWRGCYGEGDKLSADIIDIIGLEYGIPRDTAHFPDRLKKAMDLYNISLDGKKGNSVGSTTHNTQLHNTQTEPHTQQGDEADYTEFIDEASKHIVEGLFYNRGLSLEILKKYRVGYIEKWTHPKDGKHFSPRLIIPTSKSSYIARDTREGDELPKEAEGYVKMKVGKVHIFNEEALWSSSVPIFIVEGEIDALSIMDAIEPEGEAIALGSLSEVGKLLSILKEKKPSQPLIISLDNETSEKSKEAVEKAVARLRKGLEDLEIPFYAGNVAGRYHDANDAFRADTDGFIANLRYILENVAEEELARLEEEKRDLERESALYALPGFRESIEASKTASYFPTGFSDLDAILDGGLYPESLVTMGAISSLGKTTFSLAVADNIAQDGHDVIFYSMEMSRNELIGKSVSRMTYSISQREGLSSSLAKSTRGVLTGKRYQNYSREELDLIERAIAEYEKIAGHIYFVEGVGDVGATQIRERVQKHISLTGRIPLLIVDYLQLLTPADLRMTDKQATDRNVLELKRTARDYKIPILAISSFNRDSYSDPVTLSSYKESGAIEYGSDILLGLQLDGMDYRPKETSGNREKRIRELQRRAEEAGRKGEFQRIQVKVLKNRNGSRGSAYLDFWPTFNYFQKVEDRAMGWDDELSGDDWTVYDGEIEPLPDL